MKLLDWHVENGFPGVQENVLRRVYSHFGITKPEVVSCDEDEEINLVAGLMRHYDPSLTADVVEAILVRRALLQDSQITDAGLHDNDLEALRECMQKNDFQLVDKWTKEQSKAIARVEKAKDIIRKQIPKIFPTPKRKGKSKAALCIAKVPKQTLKSRTSFFAMDFDCASVVDQLKPERCAVTVDQGNGRYLLHYPRMGRKRISWTKRGQQSVVISVLRQAWDWHKRVTNEDCLLPGHLLEDGGADLA